MTLTKFYTKVFGCQMNQSDAERISGLLEKYKFKSALSIDEADLLVFVTCGVRQSAEDRIYGQINNIKKKYPEKKIILTGCLAHRKDVQRRLKNKVDLYFSIDNFRSFENWIIENCLEIENLKLKIPAQNKCSQYLQSYLAIHPKYVKKYTAFVPVMAGCNNFCAYCVVPHARGREYSRPAEDIIREIKNLIKKRYKEIVLLGQNVNSYKNILPCQGEVPEGRRGLKNSLIKPPLLSPPLQEGRIPEINFPKLLKLIEEIPGYFWLTFLTSHPKDMSDELINTIAGSKKICEYISLPAQSGDNDILRKMNRHYTIAHYKSLIKKIRGAYKNPPPLPEGRCPERTEGWEVPPSISTDIIVGFPGETKKQFENTAKLLREMKFDMAYIAQYSPRPETAAWKLKDNVSGVEKARREKVLTEILKKTAFENNKKYVGKVVEVLVDRRFDLEESQRNIGRRKVEPLKENKYISHARTQKKVIFASTKKIPIGSFSKVKITKAKAFGLEGEIK